MQKLGETEQTIGKYDDMTFSKKSKVLGKNVNNFIPNDRFFKKCKRMEN